MFSFLNNLQNNTTTNIVADRAIVIGGSIKFSDGQTFSTDLTDREPILRLILLLGK